ncbi:MULTISPECIES: iron ABC transporter permease [Acidiphilium]|uniref:ABC transporter permease n=1 Tax=Acidiphilium TaxID=522 RepID=UPI00257D778F|nr:MULTISPECIES: iron ABC transporter permease [Acidiphilium]HQT83554.1 iron ABC transporter permease [Acidiphilium rubrum]
MTKVPPQATQRPPVGLVLLGAVPAALVILPIAITVADAVTAGAARMLALVWRPLVGDLLINTVTLTLAAAICCVGLGTASAFLVERTDLPARSVWAVLATAPLAVPAFVASYAWVSISPALEGFGGALIVTVFAYTPLVYLPVAAALRGLDPALEDAARALGDTPWRCVRRVILPQLRPAMLGGALLVTLNILVEFGAFALMRFRTFTTEIYAAYRSGFDGAEAAALAMILLLFCLGCIAAEALLRRPVHYARIGRGTQRRGVPYALGVWRLPAVLGFAALAGLSLGVPILTVLYWLTRHGAAAITPAEASPLALLTAAISTIELGLGAAGLTLILALPLAVLSARWQRFSLTMPLERGAWLAQGVPGIVIALALITATIAAVPALYQSTLLLLLAYAMLFMPFALVAMRAALLQSERRAEEAAKSLGAGWRRVLWRITLPLAAPGFGAAAALVFIAVTTELTATLLLAPIGTETLATRIWGDTSTLAFAAAAPYAAVLITLSMAASWLLARRFGMAALHAQAGG